VRYLARIALFVAIALLGVYAGLYVIWKTLMPFGVIVIPAALFWIFRYLRRRFDAADGIDRGSNYVVTETLWTFMVASCLFGSVLGGMLAYNPDGYMQPTPTEPPWELIRIGIYAGAVAGALMSVAAYVLHRLLLRRT
jgi:hypothetical protein